MASCKLDTLDSLMVKISAIECRRLWDISQSEVWLQLEYKRASTWVVCKVGIYNSAQTEVVQTVVLVCGSHWLRWIVCIVIFWSLQCSLCESLNVIFSDRNSNSHFSWGLASRLNLTNRYQNFFFFFYSIFKLDDHWFAAFMFIFFYSTGTSQFTTGMTPRGSMSYDAKQKENVMLG